MTLDTFPQSECVLPPGGAVTFADKAEFTLHEGFEGL